jgi:hypothetical protein
VISLRRVSAKEDKGLAIDPKPGLVRLFGESGNAQLTGDRLYGRVEQADGTHRVAWIDGNQLRIAPVEVPHGLTVTLIADGATMLVGTTGGHLVEIPLATGEPRAVYDLGHDIEDGGTTVALAGGGYAVLDRHIVYGDRLILVPADGGGPLVHTVSDRYMYDQMRTACDGRVILLGNDLPGKLLVLGYRDGRLRQLGEVTKGFEFLGFWWGDGGFELWPSRPYCWSEDGTAEITGLEAAWDAAFAADSTETDLPLAPLADRRPPSVFAATPPIGAPEPEAAPTPRSYGTFGPYLSALLESIGHSPARETPDPAILDLTTPLMDPELLTLLHACARHDTTYTDIGDFRVGVIPGFGEYYGGIAIGTNGGGDYYIAKPDGAVDLVEHDAEGLPFRHWYSLESMLEEVSAE